MGLSIMNYRAKMIGGILEVQPGKPHGTVVTCNFPIGARSKTWLRQPSGRRIRRPAKKKVFVVDDHPIVRQGLAQMINREPDLMVCGEAEDASTALQAIITEKPDILIVDISLSGPDGLDLLKNIRTRYPSLPVLILSMHDESIYAERALRAGANGYIMKHEAAEKVLGAVRQILNHETYVSDRVASKILQRYISGSDSPRVLRFPIFPIASSRCSA